jgi:hypothetical protein
VLSIRRTAHFDEEMMKSGLKAVVTLLVTGFLALGLSANAAVITLTLPEFNGPVLPPETLFPQPAVPVGTFSFTIPAGETLVGALIDGGFGNSSAAGSAPVDLLLDGLLVGQCAPLTLCTVLSELWDHTFAPGELALLADGSAVLTAVQQGQPVIHLGITTLTLNTVAGPSAVPEPAGLLLLGSGLVLLAALRRKVGRG